jgi:predicted transcriptional regulator
MTHPEIVQTAKSLIGKYLKDCIQDSPYTKHQTASRAGITYADLDNILSGGDYSMDTFIRVLAALDLRIELMPKLIEPEQSN